MQEPSSRFKAGILSAAREPLVHFLLLGALVYALYGVARPDVEEDTGNRITVTAAEVDWLTTGWQKRWNRPPTPEERDGLIDQYVRETIFYREALAMGLDEDDTIIRRRLAQKLEFLSQDLATAVPPSEAELIAFFEQHAERYQSPALFTLTQVFVDPDRRGEQVHADSDAIGARLRALDPPTEGAADLGDPFMLQSYYPERPEAELAKLFGGGFARSVAELEPGRWHGPVLSGYGIHWVYVDHRSEPIPAQFAGVRDEVIRDLEDERRRVFDEEYYASLRARYEVVVEEAPAGKEYAARMEESP